ncbi:MAG: cytosine permease [Actinomycetales bacterium]|nr:cytosine permease [Actinomycetales bacterium]
MAQNTSGSASATTIEIHDVAPIPASDRHGKAWHLFTVWSSPNLEFATVFVGALGVMFFGLDLPQAVLAVFVGNALAAITHGLFSTFGPEAGLPQMVLGRSAFGKWGNLIPAGLSTLVAGIGWFAVNSVSGALALSALTNIPVAGALGIVVLAQILIAFVGHNLIQVWERYTSYGLAVVWIIVTFMILFGGHKAGFHATSFNIGGFTLAAGAAYGYTAGWTPFASDYTRYLPANTNKRSLGLAAGLGNFFSTTVLMSVGAVAFATIGIVDNPTKGFTDLLGNGYIAALTLLAIAIGSISANVLNVYSGAMSFLAMGFKLGFKTRRAIMVLLAGIIGGLVAYDAAVLDPKGLGHSLEGFLLVVSYWVAPWVAIILVDKLLRKGQNLGEVALSIKENLAGPIAFVVATVTSIYFFSNQYPTYVAKGAVSGIFADNFYMADGVKIITGGDATALVGFVIAAVLYWVLSKALGTTKK